MNMILFDPSERTAPDRVLLRGRRRDHIISVLRKSPGESCKVGELGGLIGRGVIVSACAEKVELEVELSTPPPPPAKVVVAAALPRPKSLRKVLHYGATLGVKEFHFFGSFKVEKSYWQSPFLEQDYLDSQMYLALEQCVDTTPWKLFFHRFFKPFAEDVLPGVAAGGRLLVAHPDGAADDFHALRGDRVTVGLGPEGGFTDYEFELLKTLGAQPTSLGERILRTETALAFLLGKLT